MQGHIDGKFTSIDKEIEFYENKNEKPIIIKSAEISYLQTLSGKDEAFMLHYTKIKILSRKANSKKFKIRKHSVWLNLIAKCDDLSAYESFLSLKVNKKGDLYLWQHKLYTEISLKRENENEATAVDLAANILFPHTHTFTNRGNIEKCLKKYFTFYPSVIEEVENEKNLGIDFIKSIVEDSCIY